VTEPVTLSVSAGIARVIAATLAEQPSARCGAAWCEVVRQMAEQGIAVELVAMEPTGRAELARIITRQNDLLTGIQEAVQPPE